MFDNVIKMTLAVAPKKNKTQPIKIVLVDDHAVFRHGLRTLLGTFREFRVCDEASRAQDVPALVQKHRPDLVILDLALGDMNGIELTHRLKDQDPSLKVLIVS